MTSRLQPAGGQWLRHTAQLAGGAVLAVASFDFGQQIGGPGLAALVALNGAFCGAIMVAWVFDLAERWRAPASRSNG